jgi:hypothetical protein
MSSESAPTPATEDEADFRSTRAVRQHDADVLDEARATLNAVQGKYGGTYDAGLRFAAGVLEAMAYEHRNAEFIAHVRHMSSTPVPAAPPSAPGWAEGQPAWVRHHDEPEMSLCTWSAERQLWMRNGEPFSIQPAAVTPLSPVPVGHVVINPAEALGLADEWHEAAQAVTNTDPASLARRAVYLRCAADLRAVRGLAGEKGQAT